MFIPLISCTKRRVFLCRAPQLPNHACYFACPTISPEVSDAPDSELVSVVCACVCKTLLLLLMTTYLR